MKFRFPIIIIDEDFRSENTSGLGIRALASAIETEGFEVLGVTSYGDMSQFAQQQSRAGAFILSIDDSNGNHGGTDDDSKSDTCRDNRKKDPGRTDRHGDPDGSSGSGALHRNRPDSYGKDGCLEG